MAENTAEGKQEQAALQQSGSAKPTVVGIGASAGGLAALKRLFELVPADSGLTFVVVVHLSPEHKSHLVDLLQPSVRFPVQQVTHTVPLEPNNVYVIPPNANLSAVDTHLRLSSLEKDRRERAPIDHFLRTLAKTHDGHSIGVILTGTGSDGTLGLREVKAKGGVILVQDPNEAEFDGMPQSAIATGLVDRVLPLADIPEALMRLATVEPKLKKATDGEDPNAAERVLLPKLIAILKTRTERDFSRYKPATLLRRIARRMQLNYLDDFDTYLEKLRENPDEARSLADDLLINVTSFFRDPEVFQKLQAEAVPHLFEGKRGADTVRVWSVGCATGEEAYSLAMMLLEEAARRETQPRIQIFASDLHKRSLDSAREGLYPGDIQTDVSPERLKRFFQEENGGYRICKEVRDTVVFAPHNLLSDPPFSRLDLIACRNLMIYLERSVQRDIIDLFHYALCPNGYLLLGSAETIDASELFRTEDKKFCIYRKRNVPAPEPRLPVFPLTRFRIETEPSPRAEYIPLNVPLEAIHQNLLERFAPPSILVDPENRLVHSSEHAGRYLLIPGGETTLNALRLVREELRIELSSLLQAARNGKNMLDSRPIPVRFNGHSAPVVMHVRPAQDNDQEGFMLVIFEEHQTQTEADGRQALEASAAESSGDLADRNRELEAELNTARQRLQATIEEYETSREEMKASHEEMQSTNEELRSTMEELETSKEELQSINEELQTVNQENRHKVEELSQLSSDLQNLLASTDIATLFLDRDFRILRFTPRLADLFNVRVTDRGRPISDLTHRLGYEQLKEDAKAVLERLIPIKRETCDDAGRWYLTRVLPYRSTEDRIEGVVITFVEITDRKRAEQALSERENRFRALVEATTYSIYSMSPDWKEMRRLEGKGFLSDTLSPESEWQRSYILPEDLPRVTAAIQDAIRTKSMFQLEHRVRLANGAIGWTLSRAVPLLNAEGEITEWFGAASDVTSRKQAEERLRESESIRRIALSGGRMGTWRLNLAARTVAGDTQLQELWGLPLSDVPYPLSVLTERMSPEGAATMETVVTRAMETGEEFDGPLEIVSGLTAGHWIQWKGRTAAHDSSTLYGVAFDITEQKRADIQLRETEERQKFLLRLSDALRPLADAGRIRRTACRLLGEYLGASRAYYVDFDPEQNAGTVSEDYHVPGLPTLAGTYPFEAFRSTYERIGTGRTWVVADVAKATEIQAREREFYTAQGVIAWANIPLAKAGRLEASLCVVQTTARQWTAEEIALIENVAERLWSAVERARAETALRKSEEGQRQLLEGMPQLVWRSQDDGLWTWSSPQWQSFTGQSVQASKGRGWLDALHPEDQQAALDAWARARETGTMEAEYRVRQQRSGTYRYHHTRSVPIRDGEGNIVEWLGTSTDIEDLKQTEAARRSIEAQFRLFVDNVHEYGLVQTDAAGTITNWNPGAERLFGFVTAEVIGKNFDVLMTEEDRKDALFSHELARVMEGHRNEDARWFVRKNGSQFWARWITEPIHDENGAFVGLAKIMRDETEREKSAAFTKTALAEKEELLKEVHHRVKNNLQVITSLLNLQADRIVDKEMLVAFDETRNRVASIASIHELLYRSSSLSAIHLADYAREFAPNLLSFYGLNSRVKVEISGDGAKLELERAVPYGLLLNELLSNALKHAFPNEREGTIRISFEQKGDTVFLRVVDDGVGLHPDFDLEKTSSLGLKLVKRLARQLRGEVSFRSSREGASVEVKFPVTIP